MKSYVIHAYLGYNIVAVQQITDTISIIRQMSRWSTSVIDSTHCVNKAILCSAIHGVNHISDEVLNSLDEQIKISAYPVLYKSLRR
jgi:hypothetical protein